MARTGKISPIKREATFNRMGDFKTLSTSLAEQGLQRFPGTFEIFTPHLERNGEYRTGLDPDALYIRELAKESPEEAEQEKARVKAMLERLKQYFPDGNASPSSPYYKDMWGAGYGTDARARLIKSNGKEPIVFDFTDPYDEITWAWMRVSPKVAPSYEAWSKGNASFRCPEINAVKFFVDDEDVTAEVQYKEKIVINKAINILEEMSPTKRLKVATLLGLDVKHYDREEIIYNSLDNYIKETSFKPGSKQDNVTKFMSVAKMNDENMKIRYLVEEALKFNIYREDKNGRIFNGEVVVGKNKEAAIEHLSDDKYQEDLMFLDEQVNQKRAQQLI